MTSLSIAGISLNIGNMIAHPERVFRTLLEALPLALAFYRMGRPDHVLRFDGGIGDDLLCSAVVREMKARGAKNIWMLTDYPELFRHNADISVTARKSRRGVRRVLQTLKIDTTFLSYAPYVNGRDIPPKRHIITELCARQHITGIITKRPYFHLRPNEITEGRHGERQIAVQSSGLSARFAARTKEWFPDRFQKLVNYYRQSFTVVQIGSTKDPALNGVIDLRGRTTIRQSAAVLANSIVFVGLVGFLQHLARSVDCRSVIIYGGRELPSQTGYTCNVNLTASPPCSPCWLYNNCSRELECMGAISVAQVICAADNQISRFGDPLLSDRELCT